MRHGYNKLATEGVNDFKKGYQPRTIIVKDEKGDLVADSYSIMTRWKNYFSQLLNVHGAKDVRQEEIHTAEPLVPEPSAFEFELAIGRLKNHKSPGIDQIPAELVKAGCRTIRCAIHKLIISIWNKEELPEEWKGSIIVPIHKKGIKQIVITVGAVKVNSICRGSYWGSSVWIPTQQVNY